MKLQALLIGCGNVGAGYDINEPNCVWSHAKAYSLTEGLELTVTDIEESKASKVAALYHAKILKGPGPGIYSQFDLISIATPTPTHTGYLQDILAESNAVVICEKPVVGRLGDVDSLISVYNSTRCKVLVNYMRRFQPGFMKAKQKMKDHFDPKALRGITIKYCRGFVNNASHAVDLLEYLYDDAFTFIGFRMHDFQFDAFDRDPTITGSCLFLDRPVNFIGFCDLHYPVFEIEMLYADSKIVIERSGNEIRYYQNEKSNLVEQIAERQTNILDRYMQAVVVEATQLFAKEKSTDNFMSSMSMNKKMLEIVQPIIK